MTQYVYFFGGGKADGDRNMKDTLGGKGSGLAEMTNAGLPVPPGFTVSTAACNLFVERGGNLPGEIDREIEQATGRLEKLMGKKLGAADDPLLVSVRSGAKFSMPGMMDTILNLGLNDQSVQGLKKRTGNGRFAKDSYRRFIQMYGNVVLGIEKDAFDHELQAVKKKNGVKADVDLGEEALDEVIERYKAVVKKHTGHDFPQDPREQLKGARDAVFKSWMNPRAATYRKLNDIPHDLGTAVNVQAMVFGNMGDTSATGVGFTRNPSTGAKEFYGEFLQNAQGEDVVAGIRTPHPIADLERIMPAAYRQLREITTRLEQHYKDVQDFEFTIQDNTLYMLQTRNGKRTGLAAIHIAVDMVEEGILKPQEAVAKVEPASLDQLLHPVFDPKERAKAEVAAKGLPASPGAATGAVVFTSDEAVAWSQKGKRVVLVRMETVPDDIHGMSVAQGVLTATGGMTCVAGETLVLTDRGMLAAEDAFQRVEGGAALRILSFDSGTLRPVWRHIIAAGRRPSEVVTVSASQTGGAEGNDLRLTADHKMFTITSRRLHKKRLDAVLADEDFVTVVGEVPSLGETTTPPELAYVAGALFSDGCVEIRGSKERVQFIQKPTPAKSDFIAAVERCFLQAFGQPFSYVRERETHSVLRGREIHGSVEDRICFRREPAERLISIRDNITTWVLTLDRTAVLSFLAGYADGDGSYNEGSSPVRLQIVVDTKKPHLLQALVLACLRVGIVPQVSRNREAALLQIPDQVDDILAFTHRIKAEIPTRTVESRCLAVRGLFEDIVESVNFMGRTREGLNRNIMFGAEKIRRDILRLCPGDARRELTAILDSPLRSYRIKQVGTTETTTVYNFEVEATEELDKNFVVFSKGLSPVLVSNSHAAVVGRQMGKPSVVGCGALHIDAKAKKLKVGGRTLNEGDPISIDGSTGEVVLKEMPTSPSEVLQVVAGTKKAKDSTLYQKFEKLLGWADEVRRLGIRANADIPRDAKVAFAFGARGIGLCRTEHMFFAEDRLPYVVKMILAAARGQRGLDVTRRLEQRLKEAKGHQAGEIRKELSKVKKEYGASMADYDGALKKLLPMQRSDFAGLFKEMHGHPVTIRTLDPPLHEFLPKREELMVQVATLKAKGEARNKAAIARASRLLRAVEELHEFNPMLGHRGCRLGITYPEITKMQARAIFEAALQVSRKGIPVKPEVMIPLVGHVEELKRQKKIVQEVAEEVLGRDGSGVEFKIGTMIEVPRGALTADDIAREAEFFSFGTNDLTQMGFGLSRDDAGKFLNYYIEHGVLDKDPFISLDVSGVGQLVEIGVQKGRQASPGLKIGICGEHGGDPASIRFFHTAGLDYVSCSPYRVPIARLAAAQAQLEKPVGD